MLELGTKVPTFDEKVEAHAVKQGWFTARPGKVRVHWNRIGTVELIGGIALTVLGFSIPASGLVLLGAAVAIAGIVTFLIGRQMPARTPEGAMIQAMLAAYRRTLDLTFRQARSMTEAVTAASLPWLETPDQGVVWGVALGLQAAVEQVLDRTMADLRDGRVADTTSAYLADLVRPLRPGRCERRIRGRRFGRQRLLELADPRPRRHVRRDRHHRERPIVERRGRRRVRRRRVRRRWGRGRRRDFEAGRTCAATLPAARACRMIAARTWRIPRSEEDS